jgi:replicative DNA helicase
MRVSDADVEALRAAMPELLAARCGVTDLRRSFRCPSPSHDDRTPSAHYYADKCMVHCFGCGGNWDVFSLVGMLDGIEGFPEQVRAVADAVGYRLEEVDGAWERGRRRAARKRVAKPRPLFDAPREAGGSDCYEAVGRAFGGMYAPGNEVGRRYLRWRGLDDGDIARFALGFVRDPREVMPEFHVWEPEALGFVVIPFFDDAGCASAHYCMCRTVSRGKVRNKEWRPRGVATPLWREWELSSAPEVLYVAEGLIDAMALSKLADGEVMALGGTSNAKRLGQVLFTVPEALRPRKVVVCMDEDGEGRKARDRIARDLDVLRVPHAVIPPYPGGAKDADEWLMTGRGSEWEFVESRGTAGGVPFFSTRWL